MGDRRHGIVGQLLGNPTELLKELLKDNYIAECCRLEVHSSRALRERNCSGDSESQLVLRSGQRRGGSL